MKSHMFIAFILVLAIPAIAIGQENVALLSRGAVAYSNGDFQQQAASLAIDGNATSYWAGLQGSYPQTLTIGFDKIYRISRLRIEESYGGGNISYFTSADFEFHDGNQWRPGVTITKNSSGVDRTFKPVFADSVRMKVTALVCPPTWYNQVACISVFEVHGVDYLDVAASTNGGWAYDNGHFQSQIPGFANDSDPGTYWAGLQSSYPQTLTIGFAEPSYVDHIKIEENYGTGNTSYFTSADFEYYDGTDWRTGITINKSSAGVERSFNPILADSVRMKVRSLVCPPTWYNKVACISSWEVWGWTAPAAFNNVALTSLGATAYDNGSFSGMGIDRDAMFAIDGSNTTYWAGLQASRPQTMTIGFDQTYQIDRIRIFENYGGGEVSYFTDADFEYFDGTIWQPLISVTKSSSHCDESFPAVVADSVRIKVNSIVCPPTWYNKVACIFGFEVNGRALGAKGMGPDQGTTPSLATIVGNYPNPFNPTTKIQFSLGAASPVEVAVMDLGGRQVATLLRDNLPGGVHEVTWTGMDSKGNPVASGMYFCVLKTRDGATVRKMTLIK